MKKVIETNNEEERTKLRSAAETFKNLAMEEWCRLIDTFISISVILYNNISCEYNLNRKNRKYFHKRYYDIKLCVYGCFFWIFIIM